VWTAEFESQKKIFTSASVRLEKFLIDNPKSVHVLTKLAQIKKKALFFTEAIEIYLDLQKEEKSVDYSVELCELYTLDSHHKDAEKYCAKASEKHAGNPVPNIYLGVSYREREMFKEAQLAFEDSLKKRKTEFAYSCLGELFYLKKDRKKTIEYLNQAIELNPLSYRAHMGLALAQFEEKMYDDALNNFKSACKLGLSDTLEIRKAQKSLEEKKSPFARNYFEEIQKCKMQSSL
jgi:tetratricopeptide (TPR) repeat protein